MTNTTRILRNIGIGLGALIVVVLVAALIVIHTDWFRNFVREQIISATEEATGGKVEIASFTFDVSHLRAVITDFVIHGTEPTGSEPLARIARVELDLKLFGIAYLGVNRPQVNVIVFPDGRTNIPEPKQKSASNTSGLETVVDLAVSRFELTQGIANLNARTQPLNIQANNFHAQLFYNMLKQGYQGQLDLEPVYVVSGRNTPVTLKVSLPVTLQKDRIDFHHASITTPVSTLSIDGSVQNMNDPRVNTHVNGHIAMIDVASVVDIPIAVNVRGVPSQIDIDANAAISNHAIDVTGLKLSVGQSSIEASGPLKNPGGNGSLQFRTQLALAELGHLAKMRQSPSGTVVADGVAKLDAANNYDVTGNIEAKNVSVQLSGKQRLSGLNLASSMHADSHMIELQGLKLRALGGEFEGNISLADFERYKLQGNLRNLDIETVARSLGEKIPYDGVISGTVDARGDTKAPGTKSIAGNAHLIISPGRRGVPVSGRLNAEYDGASDNVLIQNSFLALPHSRLTLNGSVKRELNIALATRDLKDFDATVPVVLNGPATFTGTVTGALSTPHVAGHLAVNGFSAEGRQFNALTADVAAAPNGAEVRNGTLTRALMRADFAANVGLRDWSAPPRSPLSATASISNADLADVMALAGEPPSGYSGALSASVRINGTVGNPQGSANIQIGKGMIDHQPFDQIGAQVNLADQLVTLPAAYLQSGSGRVNMTAEFRHPRDSFSTGTVHAHVQSNSFSVTQAPDFSGSLKLNADLNGALGPKEFLLKSVDADLSAQSVRVRGHSLGDFTATAKTSGQTVSYKLDGNVFNGSVHVSGNTQLAHGYPTTADAALTDIPVQGVLAVAQRPDIPARGNASGTAHFNGTMSNPQGTADIALTKATIYNEPLDRVHARVTYLPRSIELTQFEINAGDSRIEASGRYDHPTDDLDQGSARFNLTSSHIDMARIHNIQTLRPGLGGTLDINASGAASIVQKEPYVLFSNLNANIAANGISAQGHNYGDLKLTASTTSGNHLNFALDSDLADAAIHGRGTAELAGNYPVNAQVTFDNVTWSHIQNLTGPVTTGAPAFDASLNGQVSVNGPVMKTDQLNGSLQITKLNLATLPRPGAPKTIAIVNQGPLSAALDHGTVRIQNAHLTGPQTDIQLTGTASLTTGVMNAALNANADIGLLQSFDREIYSSGKVTVATTVRGTTSAPLVNGQITLQNAAFNYAEIPLGISNANGAVAFNGNSANIQKLTAEAGGGKVNVTGFIGYSQTVRFGVRADASKVRVRVQQGVSITANADVRLTGTADSSIVSGNVTVEQVTYAPQSDIGSILTRAAPPVQAPSSPSPLLDNMKLDIRVRTSPGMAVQASLAENLQANADLRVRGTAAEPGVLGRVTIDEGQLVFFGSSYTVDTGTISFYNPLRIEPVLDISLETQAKGVTVTVRVTGPIDDMKLSYTSDPPLQFQEIVSLLASGQTPTSDPTLLANQPQQPAQGFQQMGESAVLGAALADPVSSRLQRVFGVTQLKIDPSFTTGSNVPTANLTLQQRITSNLTFTYVSALNDPNGEIIRIEWAFNPQYSAVATRDQNGIFSINFFYKRQFR